MKYWLIVCGIPAVLLGLSLVVGARWFPLLVGAFALVLLGLVAANIQIRKPSIGLNALLISAVVFPVHLGSNQELSVTALIAAAVCICWLAELVLSRRKLSLHPFSPTGLSVLLAVVAVISTIVAQIQVFPVAPAPFRAQVGGLLIIVLSAGLFAWAAANIHTVEEIKTLTWRFLLAGAVVLLMYRPQLDFLARRTTDPSTVGSVFWSWLVAISAAQALFNRTLRPMWRFACLLLAAASVADAVIARPSWASGWLPPLIALSVLLVMRFPRISLIGGAIAAPALGYGILAILDRVLDVESYSLLSRLAAWSTLSKVISFSPILGLGPANYYNFTELFGTLGWYVRFSSHEQYIDLVAQLGFVGLTVFVALVWVVMGTLWRMQKRAPRGFEHAFATGAFAAAIASLASGMLADWLIPFVYNIGLKGFRSSLLFWVFLGLAMALHRIQESRDASIYVATAVRYKKPPLGPRAAPGLATSSARAARTIQVSN